MKRYLIKVSPYDGGSPECLEEHTSCEYVKNCANHCTAGDYRSQDGDTPDLLKTGDEWFCSKKPSNDGLGVSMGDGLNAKQVERMLTKNRDANKLNTDDCGEIVIHTGVFRWKDQTYHAEQETL